MKVAMTTMELKFMLDGLRPCKILCFNVHTTVEYLNRNVSIGQLSYTFQNLLWSVHGQGQKC